MAKKSEEQKLRENVLKAYQNTDDTLAKYRNHVARTHIPSTENSIIELKKKDPFSPNIHYLQNKVDALKLDVGAIEIKERTNKLGLHDECVESNEKGRKNFEALYRAVNRTQKEIELHKQDIKHNEE